MGQKIITIRGRTFAVESKSGNQTAFIIRQFEKRSDSQLDDYAAEYAADNISNAVSNAIAAGLNAVLSDIAES